MDGRLGAVLCAVVASGCFQAGEYRCATDGQCVTAAGQSGFCEAAGFCSFPDPACPSGRRWGEFAPQPEACVGSAGPDGAPGPDDAPAPDAAPPADGQTCGGVVCDPAATCESAGGSPTCVCRPGYQGDGLTCTDDDECALGTDDCDANATCANTPGGFSCACNPGWTGSGTSCADADECALGTDTCATGATCTNTMGGFGCACNMGWTGDGMTCADIDECAVGTDNCGANATCANLPGRFMCTCNMGWTGDGVTCTDINECALMLDDCHADATCTNVPGRFTCACNMGYGGDGVTCADIDECAAGTDNCDANATCANTTGGFTCACIPPYTGDGVTCVPPCVDIETFEAGTWPVAPWVVQLAGGSVAAAYAHDGGFGLRDADWHYQSTGSFGTMGERLSAWVRPSTATGGRLYLGFAASSGGAKSFVLAPNTGQLLFQDNAAWNYTDVAAAAQTYVAGRWYKLEVEFTGGNAVTGRLYDADGTTVLATLSVTYTSSVMGTAALRGFGVIDLDTIRRCQ